ncbi:MAG: hypothetical protein RQ833_04815 [Sphingomonadaceae bacterium]|nr:hypothetical protein [Sphingomonadaceae bacterium]
MLAWESLAVVTGGTLAAITILAVAASSAFRRWIDWKRSELGATTGGPASPANRIEIADLKERVRKLEAIAAGVEL